MKIGGLLPFSLLDYPGKIAAVVFSQGCNFRCPYCYNPELVDPGRYSPLIPQAEVLGFLARRRGELEACVVTGGEPTVQGDLIDFFAQVKKMSYLSKLDTNGYLPEVIEELIKRELLDYVAMDIKAPLERYSDIARVPIDTAAIARSIELIKNSGLDYEFRTTLVQGMLSREELLQIADLVRGARRFYFQLFRTAPDLVDRSYLEKVPPDRTLVEALVPNYLVVESGVR